MAVLVLYLLLAFLVTPNIMLAVLNVAVLLFFDYMHGMMGHGSEKWTTGFNVCICCAGRLCLAIGGFEYWMLGYGAAYIAYGGAISGSVINKFLPFVTAAQVQVMRHQYHTPIPYFSATVLLPCSYSYSYVGPPLPTAH